MLLPGLGQDQYLGGHTIAAGILQLHRRHVLGLVTDIGLAPFARDDDGGGDAAQFAGEGLVEERLVLALALFAFRTAAEQDGLVGVDTAGHVDLFHAGVVDQVIPHIRTAIGEAQVAGLDKRRKDVFEDRPEIIVDRAHFQDDHVPQAVQAVEHITRRDAGDVAGPQHQGNFSLRVLLPVESRHFFRSDWPR